jgi:APA family basic amino acid/polyamine antiporter
MERLDLDVRCDCGRDDRHRRVLGCEGRAPRLAVVVAVVFAAAQWRGIREGSFVQNLTSAAKAIAFAALIVAALAFSAGAPPQAARDVLLPGGFARAIAFVLAVQAVIYTYDGWSGVVYFSEEVRDPGRNIPRSLIGGVLIIIVIYVLLNLSFLHVLPIQRIAGDEFVAGAVANALFGERGGVLLRIMTIVSMLSAVNAYHLMASRVLLAMARDGLLTRRAAVVNRGGTPTTALLLSTAVAILFIVVGRTFGQVITVLAFFFIANYTLSFVSLFVLRRREPDRPRPYHAWGYPWTTAGVLAGSLAFLVGAVAGDTRNSMYALLLLAASYPAFRILKR